MKNKFIKFLFFLIVVFSVILNFNKFINKENETEERKESSVQMEYYGPYDVSYVYDGDTIAVVKNGQEIKVRLIGIDTPESVHRNNSLNTEEGKEASFFTKELLEGNKVYLVYDIDKKDKYDRTLAYVYTENKEMVNALLLEKGYAKCMSIEPNTMFEEEFLLLEQGAKKENVGFWKTGFFK